MCLQLIIKNKARVISNLALASMLLCVFALNISNRREQEEKRLRREFTLTLNNIKQMR